MTLDAKGKIIRGKIKLGKNHPFYAMLLLHMKINEVKAEELRQPTMGVSQSGDLFYCKEFVDSLTEAELKGVLIHETLHLALSHMARIGSRQHDIWNVAGDIIINNTLVQSGFALPKEVIIPQNDEVTIHQLGLTIKDISKDTSEGIYDKIYSKAPTMKIKMFGDKTDKNGVPSFDNHIYNKKGDKNKKGKKKEGSGQIADEKEWEKRLIEAAVYAKMRGKLPAHIETIIENLVNNKVDWKRLLQKYITNEIFSDFTWSRPSRRSISTGIYMPAHKKENVTIAVAIDTSGSISQEELTSFVSEIVHIVKSTNNLKAFIIQCDAQVREELEVKNGDIPKILNMKIKGRGGTDHKPVFEAMRKDKRDVRVLINFTDGFTSFPEKNNFPFETIWVLTKESCKDENIPFGKIIRME